MFGKSRLKGFSKTQELYWFVKSKYSLVIEQPFRGPTFSLPNKLGQLVIDTPKHK